MKEEEIEKLIKEYQLLADQLQSFAVQKDQFSIEKEEYKESLKELENATGKIYMSVGSVIIEASKEEAIKKIKEKQESVEMRLSLINRQYEDLSKKEKEMREKINKITQEMYKQ
ncbi:MAG: prefoldin subunit [Candidatus Micrarchaeia archaeon]